MLLSLNPYQSKDSCMSHKESIPLHKYTQLNHRYFRGSGERMISVCIAAPRIFMYNTTLCLRMLFGDKQLQWLCGLYCLLQVSVGIWNAGKNNMGFGMNRKTWEQIKSCKEVVYNYCVFLLVLCIIKQYSEISP